MPLQSFYKKDQDNSTFQSFHQLQSVEVGSRVVGIPSKIGSQGEGITLFKVTRLKLTPPTDRASCKISDNMVDCCKTLFCGKVALAAAHQLSLFDIWSAPLPRIQEKFKRGDADPRAPVVFA